MTKSVLVRITGRVQGVGYRAWCADEANLRHLAGWVRNRRDGSVEAVFSGDGTIVDAMLDRLRQGPPGAKVRELRIVPAPDDPSPSFEIRETL